MNQFQKIQLERVKLGSFNAFDGEDVAKDLEDNEHLYKSFLFGRFGNYYQLIELRDLQHCLNADTLMVLTTKEHVDKIYELANKWGADEIGHCYMKDNEFVHKGIAPFYDRKELFGSYGGSLDDGDVIVRIWWD